MIHAPPRSENTGFVSHKYSTNLHLLPFNNLSNSPHVMMFGKVDFILEFLQIYFF